MFPAVVFWCRASPICTRLLSRLTGGLALCLLLLAFSSDARPLLSANRIQALLSGGALLAEVIDAIINANQIGLGFGNLPL